MNKAVSTKRQKLWKQHKAALPKRRDAYWEYVELLIAIVDSGSYLEEYETQAEFLKHEASFTDRYFRNLRAACEARQRIGTVVPVEQVNERQLRELAKAPENQQAQLFAEVAEEAEKSGKKVTAAAIRSKVKKVAPTEPAPEPVEDWTVEEDQPEAMEPWELAIRDADRVATFTRQIRSIIRDIKKVDRGPATDGLVDTQRAIVDYLENAANKLKSVTPSKQCHHCGGGGCPLCSDRGWLSVLSK